MSEYSKDPEFLGAKGSLALFGLDGRAVIIDINHNLVVESGPTSELSSKHAWELSDQECSDIAYELASSSLIDLNITITAAGGDRLYTIPKGAQAEAKKALEWRKEHKRGGTPVGLNTARTLANGGQIGIEKVRHIAKYFPRHEVDKKGKGWAPGEDNFPSNGRIAWALWGGDTAWRWAAAIVERENKKAKTASAAPAVDLESFSRAISSGEGGPEFMARVRMDGSGLDRLYKLDIDGSIYVWDDGQWDSMGQENGDVYSYNFALDDEYDLVEKSIIPIDPESAIIFAAKQHQNPDRHVSVTELDEEEARLATFAAEELDWDFIDYTLTAAGVNPDDKVYSPEERSQNASVQLRNALGRFAKQGQKVSIDGAPGRSGTITSTDPSSGSVSVKMDNGQTVNIPAKKTRPQTQQRDPLPLQDIVDRPLDVSGILGEPRTPIDQPYAHLPGTLPSMTKSDLHDVLYNWPAWVQQQRNAYNGIQSSGEQKDERDAYDHPLLKIWRHKVNNRKKEAAEEPWASPMVAAPTAVKPREAAKKSVQMTPDTSDVQPLYMAVVADDDPRAVMDLVAIVPASSTSNAPMTYKRDKGKWVREEKILNDFKSATPPPVIPLDSSTLNDVLLQVDEATMTASGVYSVDHLLTVLWGPGKDILSEYEKEFISILNKNLTFDESFKAVFAVIAAGGFDRNRGNAEELRRYWTHGKGAAKIRWGTPGDWKRCVRHLGKYLGTRAKGYCQLRHKDALGYYTATHAKRDRARHNSVEEFIMEEVWGENIGAPTEVTEPDMLMPIEDIMKEQDDLYDSEWTPEERVVYALEELAKCSDDEFEALVAAGGLDRNRGNAEELRRYWTIGRGAAKIRWGTGGDWTRCVRNLSKYMGPRSKGYCALRHKEMTGVWTGDKKHRQMYGKNRNGRGLFSTELVHSSAQVIENAITNARAAEARERFGIVASGSSEVGARFYIPLLIPEGIESGDGRKFEKGAITMRELPLPLLWQIKTAQGHDGSVVVGKIEHLERTEDGLGNAYGVFDSGHYGKEAERLVRNGFIRGISADMDQFEAKEEKVKSEAAENEDEISKKKIVINKARVMAATIVPKPAFQECSISLIEDGNLTNQEENMVPDGIYVDDVDAADAEALVACGIVAGVIPVVPPREWFDNPRLKQATPLTVDDAGRVFGHIAAWDVNHIGMAYGTKPPRSRSNYAYFHTGVCRTDDGSDVPVGQLTLAGGHASLEASAMEAVKHYDDTASAIADVHAGEDAYGIWVAGSLRPNAQPDQIRALRASAPSGDWRPIRGSLELVAVCQVNVPGFPVARARVASGSIMALVAAGAATLAKMKDDPMSDLQARIMKLENTVTPKEELEARVASLRSKVAEFGYISRDERNALAEKGHAMPDGSYPIRDIDDLKNAIQAYGRSNPEDRSAVKKHIEKRARQLNLRHLIPEKWKNEKSSAVTASADSLKSRLAAAQEALGKTFAAEEIPTEVVDKVVEEVVKDGGAPAVRGYKFTPGKNQPRDIKGRFRQVLARLKQDIGDAELQDVTDKIKEVENITGLGDYEDAAKAGNELVKLLDRLDEGSLNAVSLENVRKTAAELGKVISNLPLPFKDQAQKVRFSDLPPALQQLMENMVDRVEKKIGKDDAAEATAGVKGFMSGSDVYSQGDISSEMAKMLRLLT